MSITYHVSSIKHQALAIVKRFDYKKTFRQRNAPQRRRRDDSAAVTPGAKLRVGGWFASGRVFSLLLLIASLGGLMYIFTAPAFAIHTVRVEGAQALADDAVINLAHARGQSVWFVNTAQIVDRVQASAYVEQARVYVALPDRLVIQVRERQPEVRWQVGNVRYLVDGSGRVLGVDSSAPISDTLVIDDHTNRQLRPNDHIDTDALRLGQALALRLPKELNLRPSAISWDDNSGMAVTTPDHRTVMFGRSDRLEDKLAILNVLLHDGTAFTFLDLRSGSPFYRNEGAAEAPAPSDESSSDAEPTPEQ